ncbi:MAG: hypothetical protein M1828_006273 [Chrysothrix sp. TS-e1954]|nr:MAG: hypothetical protein M1828_006273 [Chrysothrix sp. TS-e1954]
MSEDSELHERIAQLAGRINRHKTTDTASQGGTSLRFPVAPKTSLHQQKPYSVPSHRGRTRGHHTAVHRNRTLVLNGASQYQPEPDDCSTFAPSSSSCRQGAAGWVTKHDRHMQLINSSIYEQHSQARVQAIEKTRKKKEESDDAQSIAKVHSYLRGGYLDSPRASSMPLPSETIINGIRFIVADGGSKLMKANGVRAALRPTFRTDSFSGELNSLKMTPKRAKVGGVTFVRSKRGNLYRAGFVRTKR